MQIEFRRMSQFARKTLALIATTGLLTACSWLNPPASTPESSSSQVNSSPSASTPQATSLPVDGTLVAMSTGLSCDRIISVTDLYAFNPNYSLDTSRSPKVGSTAKLLTDFKGVSCSYLNLSSGDVIDVAVAKFDPNSMNKVKELVVKSAQPTTALSLPAGSEAFFTREGGNGAVNVVTGNYWVIVSASFASSAADLHVLAETAVKNLK